jgi:hypothetical protein
MTGRAAQLHWCVVLVASLTAACSTLPVSSASLPVPDPRGSAEADLGSHMIERRDFVALDVSNAAEVVGRLRPEFLRGSGRRPPIGLPEIAVFVNDVYNGDPSTLNMIPVDAINSVAFLQASSGYARFGPRCRCANGAIMISVLGKR